MWYLTTCGQNGVFFMHCAFLQLSVPEESEPQLYINSDGTVVKKLQLKTSFNYCSSGSGQNSIIPVVCDVPE